MTDIEKLEERIDQLEQLLKDNLDAVEGLTASATNLPQLALDDYELNENEKRVLTLLSVGLPGARASKAAGMSKDYASMRLKDSLEFAKAYQDVKKRVREWAEARLSFTLPLAWRVLDRILLADPEDYLAKDSPYARAVLKAQEKVAKQIVSLDAGKDAKLTIRHELEDPLLQVQQRSLDLVARHMARLERLEAEGKLEELTPEWQVLEAQAKTVSEVVGGQPVSYEREQLRCLECDSWQRNLHAHIHSAHGMSVTEYKEKHDITLTHRLDFDSFMQHQAYLEE
jgi:cell division septum initiation protein DivIVA